MSRGTIEEVKESDGNVSYKIGHDHFIKGGWVSDSPVAPPTMPPGREVAKTFTGRGDGVLVGMVILEEHSRRGGPRKPRIERIPRQRQQRPRGGPVRTYSREVNADIKF